MKMSIDRRTVIKSIKIALGSAAAIVLSGLIGLDYATSAGIITLLTIQDTKTDTLRLSVHRLLSFAVSMAAAWLICKIPVHNTVHYCIYLLVVVEVSYLMKWDGSISTNAVFGTHIFISNETAHVTAHVLINESGLLIIGTLMAMLMNWKMPDLEREIKEDIEYVEKEIKRLFGSIVQHLSEKNELDKTYDDVLKLAERLDGAVNLAANNMSNTENEYSQVYLDYFLMRRNQCAILRHLIRSFESIESIPEILRPAVDFLNELASGFSVMADADEQLSRLETVMGGFKSCPLPASREEFETRATVYHIMNEAEEFIKLKRNFWRQTGPDRIRLFSS